MGKRWIAVGIAGLLAWPAFALEPDNLELLVPREHAVGAAGGAFAAYGYVRSTGDFCTGIYGASSGIRFFDVSEGTSTNFVYPSDLERMSRSDWITNGYFNADWSGGWYISSLALNPTNLTYNGVSYGPDALAAMTTMPSKTDDDWAYTRGALTYDLREIWAPTTRQPDYDNAMFSNPPIEYDRDYGYGFGYANWNDVITSLASVQEMADAVGLTEITRSARNGRQAAWSSDGQSVYFVDHGRGNGFGGLWKRTLPTGELVRILDTEMDGDGLYSEPCVLHPAVRNVIGVPTVVDQILLGSSATLLNTGGLNCVLDDGSQCVVIPAPRIEHFLGQAPRVRSITADGDGTIFFFNQQSPAYGIYLLDTAGRLVCIDNKARRFAWHQANGNTSTASMSVRLQNRRTEYDPDGVSSNGDEYEIPQVMFMSVNLRGVGGVNVFRPCDFDRDGALTSADTAFFGTQYARTSNDTNVLQIADTQEYLDYVTADLNGDAVPESDGTVLMYPAVTGEDVEVLLRFVNKLEGDANLDGSVDAADQAILQAHLGGAGSWLDGDFDRNGLVDASDEALWAANQGTSYALDGFDPAASYVGGGTGAWDGDVVKSDGTTPPDGDTIVTLDREAGAAIQGPVSDTAVGYLAVGNGGSGAGTELELAAGTRLSVPDGIHLRRTGRLPGSATLAMGSWGRMGSLYVEEGATFGPSLSILGGLHLNPATDLSVPNFVGDNGANPGGIVIDSPVVVTVGAANDYTGTTLIHRGTLRLGASGCLPDISPVVIDDEGTLDLNGFDETIGPLSGSGFVLLGDNVLSVQVPAAVTSSWQGAISGTGTLVKTGGGMFTISSSASNTFGRAGRIVMVSGGTLGLSNSEGLGDAANGVELQEGTLCALQTFSLPRSVTMGNEYGGVCVSSGRILTLAGAVTGPGSLRKTGLGTLRITGPASFGGSGRALSVLEGIFETNGNAELGDAANGLVLDAGIVRVRTSFASLRALECGAGGGEARVDSGKTLTWNGPIGGVGGLTKASSGILDLAGAVDLAGGILISAGTVACRSGAAVDTDIHVAASGVFDASTMPSGGLGLGGRMLEVAGTVRGIVTNAVVHPGLAAAGTATFADNFVAEGTGSLVWDLRYVDGEKGDPFGWDWLHAAGTLTVAATASEPYLIRLRTLGADGLPGETGGFDGSSNYVWTVATADAGIAGFDAAKFAIDASEFANPDALGDWSVDVDGNDLVVQYAAALPGVVLLAPDRGFRWYKPGDPMEVLWASVGLGAADPIGIELRRASATNGVDGVNWYRFTPDTINDGAETVTVPGTIAAALDWHVRVTHFLGSSDESAVAFTIGADGDNDGLPDVYEEEHFEGTAAETGAGDADDDGCSNECEFRANTDPNDSEDYPRIDSIGRDGEAVVLTWPADGNRYYRVEAADTAAGGFSPAANYLSSQGGSLSYTGGIVGVARRVFRVGIEVDDE